MKNVFKRKQYNPRTKTFILKIYSSLKTKADLAGGGGGQHAGNTPRIGFEFEYLGENTNLYPK
jgi:hypothetical protein